MSARDADSIMLTRNGRRSARPGAGSIRAAIWKLSNTRRRVKISKRKQAFASYMADGETDKRTMFLDAYERYAEAIFRHCFFRVWSREKAEDIMQDTFLKIWQYLDAGKEIENIRPFLYRVATNLIIDHSRRKKNVSLDSLLEEAGSAAEPSYAGHKDLETQTLLREVFSEMNLLSEEDEALVLMRYVDDLGPKEIAEILKTDANNVSVKLNRAVAKLRKIIIQPPRNHE